MRVYDGAAWQNAYSSQAGKVLQVLQAIKTDTFTTTGGTFTDVPSLSIAITPSSASSKIMITVHTTLSNTTSTAMSMIRLMRDSTPICIGDAAGTNRPQATGMTTSQNTGGAESVGMRYLDSPATTSEITYKVQLASYSSWVAVLNRTGNDADEVGKPRLASTIIVEEIGA